MTLEERDMERTSCAVCGSADAVYLWTRGEARYERCRSCGLVFENPRLDGEELRRLYSDESYYVAKDSAMAATGYENYFEQCTHGLIEEYFSIVKHASGMKTGRLLDVGSGPGNLVAHAIDMGWDAVGQEISQWACTRAREKGIPVLEGPLEDQHLPDASFDAASMFDVLEHLTDPRRTVEEIRRVLKPGGVLVIETPNIGGLFARFVYRDRSDLVKPRSHICLFSPRSIRRLMDEAGFSRLTVQTFPYCRRITPGYLKDLLLSRIQKGRKPVQFTVNDSLRIICTK